MTKEEVITLLGPPQSNSSGSLDGLAAIRPGMTSEEVTRLLAAPQGNSVDGPIHRIRMLRYWSRFRWCSVDVFLDQDDRVQSYLSVDGKDRPNVFHDH